jgi:Spy/CpxP family protein refolding chaperone
MLRRPLSLALPLVFALAAPALGCSGTVSSEPVPVTAETATTRAPVAQSTHGHLKVIGDALGDVPLTASQRAAIEKLASDADARHADSRAALKDLMLTVATQVQAGQIDRSALQPKVDALVAAFAKAQPADRAALEQLHALLTPEQRTAFADALEARIAERISQVHDKHPLKQWAVDLQLSDQQKAQIKDALSQRWQGMAQGSHDGPPWAEARHQGAKIISAFKQERFVMDEVAPRADLGTKAQKMSDRFLGMAEAALPVLTPQQRALAAQKLRDRAESMDDAEALP